MVPADENGQPLFPFGSNVVPPLVLLGSNEEPRMFGGREGQPKPPSNEWDAEDYIDYIRRSINQIILGSYTDDVTALGTLGQIGLGFTGLDLPADVREVSHDITNWHWTWEHAGETALDVIGLIPVVGMLKNADEAAELVTGALKHSDELLGVGDKHGDDVVDAARGGFRRGDEVLEGAGRLTGSLDGLKQAERIMVNYLLSQGENVKIIPRSNVSGVKTPDVKVNGVLTELKSLSGTSLNTPVTRIQEGFQQGAQIVIIDARASGLTVEQANTVINQINGVYPSGVPGQIQIWTTGGKVFGGR